MNALIRLSAYFGVSVDYLVGLEMQRFYYGYAYRVQSLRIYIGRRLVPS